MGTERMEKNIEEITHGIDIKQVLNEAVKMYVDNPTKENEDLLKRLLVEVEKLNKIFKEVEIQNENVFKWYACKYPTDINTIHQLNKRITFREVANSLNKGQFNKKVLNGNTNYLAYQRIIKDMLHNRNFTEKELFNPDDEEKKWKNF